jgi:glucokinase
LSLRRLASIRHDNPPGGNASHRHRVVATIANEELLQPGAYMHFLLGDIGGTNARFALVTDRQLGQIRHVTAADYPNVGDAITAFLSHYGASAAGAVLAVAGPIAGERCAITNSPWVIEAAALRSSFGFSRVHLVNDFEAVALSLPHLTAADLFPIGGGEAERGEPMLVLGPGTGFGAAALVWQDGRAIPIATEGGHNTLPGTSPREDAIIEHLRGRFGHVSIERAVSGPGLENLYNAIAALDGLNVPARNPNDITNAALHENCGASRMALDMFCAMLGTVAGNLALTFRAAGGVYIAGGIAPRIVEFLATSDFRARFESKGRFQKFLQRIPTSVIVHPYPSFPGLQALTETMGSEPR